MTAAYVTMIPLTQWDSYLIGCNWLAVGSGGTFGSLITIHVCFLTDAALMFMLAGTRPQACPLVPSYTYLAHIWGMRDSCQGGLALWVVLQGSH